MKKLLVTTLALAALVSPLMAHGASAATADWSGKAGTVKTKAGKVWIGKDGTVLIQSADGKTLLMLEHDGDAMLLAPDGHLVDVDHGKPTYYEPAGAADETGEIHEKLEALKKEAGGK